MHNLTRPIIFSILSLCLIACSESNKMNEMKKYIRSVKQRKARPIEPIPDFKPLPGFKYPENSERRNPFAAVKIRTTNQGTENAPNTNRLRQPLENFAIDSLKFVGLLKQGGLTWGLITTPISGEIKRVQIGNYMGKNYGKVIKINDKSITIEERVKVGSTWDKRITKLNINSTSGE